MDESKCGSLSCFVPKVGINRLVNNIHPRPASSIYWPTESTPLRYSPFGSNQKRTKPLPPRAARPSSSSSSHSQTATMVSRSTTFYLPASSQSLIQRNPPEQIPLPPPANVLDSAWLLHRKHKSWHKYFAALSPVDRAQATHFGNHYQGADSLLWCRVDDGSGGAAITAMNDPDWRRRASSYCDEWRQRRGDGKQLAGLYLPWSGTKW